MRRRWVQYLLAAGVLLLGWQASAVIAEWFAPGGASAVIPPPGHVLGLLVVEMATPQFWQHVGVSSYRVAMALVISFVLAVPLGLFLGSTPKLDRITQPLVYLSYPVPKIVLLPVVFLIFGLGNAGKIAMLVLILFFQLFITTRDAARELDREFKYSLLSLGGTKRHLFVHVIWPSSLPAIFTALRIATGTVIAVLFFVESVGTRYGLGFYILDAWGRADITEMFVGILAMSAMGVILYELFEGLEKWLCGWKQM
jgi:ABC-type nitrate/sulfonate/bicarbonate transport system permease component